MKILIAALGFCLLAASNDYVSPSDTSFANSTMHVMLQSVANAEAVEAAGTNPLATSVRTDELNLGTRLASLADSYGINVNTDVPKGDTNGFNQSQITSLTQLIAICEQEKQNGSAAQLRAFAAEAIPLLQKDLDAAKAAK